VLRKPAAGIVVVLELDRLDAAGRIGDIDEGPWRRGVVHGGERVVPDRHVVDRTVRSAGVRVYERLDDDRPRAAGGSLHGVGDDLEVLDTRSGDGKRRGARHPDPDRARLRILVVPERVPGDDDIA